MTGSGTNSQVCCAFAPGALDLRGKNSSSFLVYGYLCASYAISLSKVIADRFIRRATTTAAATTVPLPATRTRTTTPTRTVATTTPTPMVSTSNGSRVYMGVSKALLTLIIGSTYHNDGQGGSTYTPPNGGNK